MAYRWKKGEDALVRIFSDSVPGEAVKLAGPSGGRYGLIAPDCLTPLPSSAVTEAELKVVQAAKHHAIKMLGVQKLSTSEQELIAAVNVLRTAERSTDPVRELVAASKAALQAGWDSERQFRLREALLDVERNYIFTR